jgi:hypothetical protein
MKTTQNDKYDTGKDRLDLVDPGFIINVAKVMTYGLEIGYKKDSWKKVHDPINRYYAALMRHILAWRSGEIYDNESGFHHLAHAGTNIMILLWFELKNNLIRRNKNGKDTNL